MKQRLWLIVRVVGTLGALAWIVSRVDFAAAGAAVGRISPLVFVAAVALVAGNVGLSAVRWRAVLRAYGATRIPGLAALVRLYFVAFFYNNYLPGAVAGDVARGVVTRDAFADEGATGALAVVLVERALGLFSLFALLAIGLVTTPGALDRRALWWWTVLGSAGSLALVTAIPLARTLGRHLPARLARIAHKLPALREPRAFLVAIALSVASQALIATAGWLLLAQLAPIPFTGSLLVVPLAAATAFLPITVGGAGAREAVYVQLCGSLFAMPEASALAASLGLWLAHLVCGAFGGVAQLAQRKPRRLDAADASRQD
ncbi:MAG TPA: lysylphosphatidylglycerol synthase transmembrane domain-containing protein [Kofleriaceae bacterium]|nr:lysylphosphatidylglycerol synthase transmembrane domain-containing protein [Kofleriaceae bacterium]